MRTNLWFGGRQKSCVPVLVCEKVIQILMTDTLLPCFAFFSFLKLEDVKVDVLPYQIYPERLEEAFVYQLGL
jgi:hypothetical protein